MSISEKLYLYEALELRAEYDARIKTVKECLPESRKNRDRFSFSSEKEYTLQPSPEFDVKKTRKELQKLDIKRRKLNAAIQKTNFENHIKYKNESITLNEALEVRKRLNEEIGELHSQTVNAAYQKVIYKEDRDIIEKNEVSYEESVKNLNSARLDFRKINRAIRKASYKIQVDFIDE